MCLNLDELIDGGFSNNGGSFAETDGGDPKLICFSLLLSNMVIVLLTKMSSIDVF